MVETHMTTPHLAEGVRDALEDLVKCATLCSISLTLTNESRDLLAVQRVLGRMSGNGLVHRYVLQSNDQYVLSNCASRLQDAHMSFMVCVSSLARETTLMISGRRNAS